MSTKPRPKLLTGIDASAFIQGASDRAPTVIVGEKAEMVAESIVVPQETAQAIEKIVEEVDALVGESAAAPVQAPPSLKKATPAKKTTKPKVKDEPKPEPQPQAGEGDLPWEGANPKVRSFVQLRAPEPLLIKLRWIRDNSVGNHSMHDLILMALEEMADRRIAGILKNKAGQGGNQE